MSKSVADMLYGDLPHTAYISVSDAVSIVDKVMKDAARCTQSVLSEMCKAALRDHGAAFVVPVRTGIWKKDSDGIPCCSECGKPALQRLHMHLRLGTFDAPFVESDFCPECGALLKVPAYAET